jgi:hypothetical protein
MVKRSSKKCKRDSNVLAKYIVDEATGQMPPKEPEQPDPDKDPKAVKAGRLGGLKGGKARAAKLTSAQRREIAKKAAKARWKKVSRQSS